MFRVGLGLGLRYRLVGDGDELPEGVLKISSSESSIGVAVEVDWGCNIPKNLSADGGLCLRCWRRKLVAAPPPSCSMSGCVRE